MRGAAFLNTPENLARAQLSPARCSLLQAKLLSLANMLLSRSHRSQVGHTLKHVKVRSDATRGFIVTLSVVAGGAATVRLHIFLMQGESTARWVDEPTRRAVKSTSQSARSNDSIAPVCRADVLL